MLDLMHHPRSDRRCHRPDYADSHDHEDHRDQSRGRGHRKPIAVPDRGDCRRSPPQGVPEGCEVGALCILLSVENGDGAQAHGHDRRSGDVGRHTTDQRTSR